MRIGIISLFPDMFTSLEHGVTGRAIDQQKLTIEHWNPRDFTRDVHRRVDDRPYGGGPGMVMMAGPLDTAIQTAKDSIDGPSSVILLSPQGKRLDQAAVNQLATRERLILVAGRYEGVDERFIQESVDETYSIGDYVLSGGELPAMVLIDSIARQLPGVLGNEESAKQDSFSDGLLDFPHFTRPACYNGAEVPKVLISGDHQAIARWRLQQALGNTWQYRPDLIAKRDLSELEQQLLQAYIDEHNDAKQT